MWNAIAVGCRKATAVGIALSTSIATVPVSGEAATAPSGTKTPIKHLVVIFQEKSPSTTTSGPIPVALNPKGEPSVHARPRIRPPSTGYTDALLNNNPNSESGQRGPVLPIRSVWTARRPRPPTRTTTTRRSSRHLTAG